MEPDCLWHGGIERITREDHIDAGKSTRDSLAGTQHGMVIVHQSRYIINLNFLLYSGSYV